MKISPETAVSTIKMKMMTATIQVIGKPTLTIEEFMQFSEDERFNQVEQDWSNLTDDEERELDSSAHSLAHEFLDMLHGLMVHHEHETGHEPDLSSETVANMMSSYGRLMYLAGIYAQTEETEPSEDLKPDPAKLMNMSLAMNGWRAWARRVGDDLGEETAEDARVFNKSLLTSMVDGLSEDQATAWMEDIEGTCRTTLGVSFMLLEPEADGTKDYFTAACAAATVAYMAGVWSTLEWVK